MIVAITGWIKGIVIVVLFAAFLDLLLPSSSIQKFVRVIMGLFIMMAILNPVIDLIDKSFADEQMPAASNNFNNNHLAVDIADASLSAASKREQLTRDYYVRDLIKQIRATVLSIEGVADAKVTISLEEISKQGGEVKLKNQAAMPQIKHVGILVRPDKVNFDKEMRVDRIVVNDANNIDSSNKNTSNKNTSNKKSADEREKTVLKPLVKEKIERTISELYHIRLENIKVMTWIQPSGGSRQGLLPPEDRQ